MKNSILGSIIIVVIIIFQSCTLGPRRVNCSAFPEWFRQYAPYTEGTTIKYSNGTDIMKFEIKTLDIGKEYKNPIGCKCICENDLFVNGISNDTTSFWIHINLQETYFKFYYRCKISNDQCGYMSIPEKNPFKEKNFEKFEDTLRLDNQYNKRFSDMVIVKGKGLTEFYDKENNCTWRLLE